MASKLWNIIRIENVSLSAIRHNDRPVYIEEGFGGHPITQWPVHDFFKTWQSGQKELAQEAFALWYSDQFIRQAGISKSEGGMKGGNLYKLIRQQHEDQGKPFSPDDSIVDNNILIECIKNRVQQRFALLEKIASEGFKVNDNDRIIAFREKGNFYLLGGHHRVAALLALGYHHLPVIYAFPNRFIYKFCQRILNSFRIRSIKTV